MEKIKTGNNSCIHKVQSKIAPDTDGEKIMNLLTKNDEDCNNITRNDVINFANFMKLNVKPKSLTKKQKIRIISCLVNDSIANKFAFYGIRLLSDKDKNKIINGLKKVLVRNGEHPKSDKINELFNQLAMMSDFVL